MITIEKKSVEPRLKARIVRPFPVLASGMLLNLFVNTKNCWMSYARWGKMLLVLCLVAEISASAQILPANRTPNGLGNWVNIAGVPGGIPNRTTIYQTIAAGASAATVQTALNACPSNQVVLLSAGTYTWSATVTIPNGVTLRGAGTGSTIINSSQNPVIWFHGYNPVILYSSAASGTHVSWTGGYTQGGNVITVASTSGLTVGKIIWMDQLNDSDTSANGLQQSGNITGGAYSTASYPSDGRDRYQFQLNTVTAINGNQLTLSEPVYMPNWSSSLSPQVWWESSSPMSMAGVENLAIHGTAGSGNGNYGIQLYGCYACWIKNVNLTGFRYYTFPCVTVRCEIRHCMIYGPHSTTDDYGYYPKFSSGLLVEDNIGNDCGSIFLIQGVSGSVFAYNYATNLMSQSGYMTYGYLPHGGNPNMILFEGNWGPGMGMDNTWGSAAYNTVFRNRFVGKSDSGIAANGNIEAVQISAVNRHMNIVGNVLGTSGYNTYYDDTVSSCHDPNRVYFWGGNSACTGTDDPLARSTAIRAYNWTSATSTNNGITADGYSASAVPNSLYLSSKPSYFGNLTWPPIDPANPTYSMSRTNIPAGYRFVFGVDPPTNSITMNQDVHMNVPADFSGSPITGQAPLTVHFTSGSQWGINSLLNFGDGGTTTNTNPNHVYSSSGTYTVTLYNVISGTNQAAATYNNYITVTN